MSDDLQKSLEQHKEAFNGFHEDWKAHRIEAKETSRKVDMINTSLASLAPSMAHLNTLPLIAQSLSNIDKGNAMQMTALIAQAGQAGKSNSNLMQRTLILCIVTVAILGVALVILFIRDSNKDFKADINGFSITTPEHAQPFKKNQENAQ